jgi:hypothetical protein
MKMYQQQNRRKQMTRESNNDIKNGYANAGYSARDDFWTLEVYQEVCDKVIRTPLITVESTYIILKTLIQRLEKAIDVGNKEQETIDDLYNTLEEYKSTKENSDLKGGFSDGFSDLLHIKRMEYEECAPFMKDEQ